MGPFLFKDTFSAVPHVFINMTLRRNFLPKNLARYFTEIYQNSQAILSTKLMNTSPFQFRRGSFKEIQWAQLYFLCCLTLSYWISRIRLSQLGTKWGTSFLSLFLMRMIFAWFPCIWRPIRKLKVSICQYFKWDGKGCSFVYKWIPDPQHPRWGTKIPLKAALLFLKESLLTDPV